MSTDEKHIAIIGHGGRETAIIKSLNNSNITLFSQYTPAMLPDNVKQICIPHNPDWSNLLDSNGIDCVFVGSENYLAEGIADICRELNIVCIGPTKKLAQLETSKIYARKLIANIDPKYNPHWTTNRDMDDTHFSESFDDNIVIKQDGLCGGKGVFINHHRKKLPEFLTECNCISGDILIEERLYGTEFGLFSLTDGRNFLHFPPVFDFKTRSKDGPNTGGMASIMFTKDNEYNILRPGLVLEAERLNEMVIKQLQQQEGDDYHGFVYGSFITDGYELKVIEYNVRLGDPEAIVLQYGITNFGEILLNFMDWCHSSNLLIRNWSKIPIQFRGGDPVIMTKYIVPPSYGLDFLCEPVTDYLHINPDIDRDKIYIAHLDSSFIMKKSRTLAVIGTGFSAQDAEQACDLVIHNNIFGKNWGYRKDIFTNDAKICSFMDMIRRSLQPVDKSRGVDLNAANRFVSMLKNLGACDGGFAAELPINYDETLTVTCDGVGTKVLLAETDDDYAGLGADIFNHCANDLLVQGGVPAGFINYIGCHTLDPEKYIHIVRGMKESASTMDVKMMGGETAEMPDIYKQGVVDIVGMMIGITKVFDFDYSKIHDGTVILALPSNGLHTNGYTTARHILGESGCKQWKKELLATHTNYAEKLIDIEIYRNLDILALCHITGGGLIDNPVRVLPKGCTCVFDKAAIFSNMPEIFKEIQLRGSIPDDEMLHIFNCGVGMLIFADNVDNIIKELPNARVVGHVTMHAPDVQFV